MKLTINESFLKRISGIFSDLDRTMKHPDSLAYRKKVVRTLLSHMATRFDSSLAGLLGNPMQACGIESRSLDFLQHYKYRIDERDGSEFVTPEVLGSLVERFGTDRAKFGTYYTPPVIASFMCRRSLELLTGVSMSEVESLPMSARQSVAEKIATVKVIDPASGGGAFLVAMQYELAVWRARLSIAKAGGSAHSLQVYGIDLDELAVAAARIRLACASKVIGRAVDSAQLKRAIRTGDGLLSPGELPSDGQYDIVVTNPPYGVAADIETRNRFFDPERDDVQSRDLYGLFIARSMQLVKPGGIAILLVSDTWRTIRRHLPLRKLLANMVEVAAIVDLPSWIFPVTVNTGVVVLRNSPPRSTSVTSTIDLRSVSKDAWDELSSSPDRAPQFQYQQSQAAEFSRISFFIASPQLHRILTDPAFTTLGEIATVRQGLATGDNKRYLRKLPSARGNYFAVDPSCILSTEELSKLSPDEKRNGLSRFKFGERVFVPYDKGGASSTEHGWLPNYYVPTEYFIDWSEEAVAAIRTTTSNRQGGKIAARFQNAEHYFKQGITFSYTGYYAPSFRLSSGGVFDVGGSSCFDLQLPLHPVLAMLASKLMKYIAKNYINHTVNFQVDDFKALPLPRELERSVVTQLEVLVTQIVEKQKIDPRYRYHRNEQVEIDGLVSRLYGLEAGNVREVEEWYGRKYPKLT